MKKWRPFVGRSGPPDGARDNRQQTGGIPPCGRTTPGLISTNPRGWVNLLPGLQDRRRFQLRLHPLAVFFDEVHEAVHGFGLGDVEFDGLLAAGGDETFLVAKQFWPDLARRWRGEMRLRLRPLPARRRTSVSLKNLLK